MGTHVCEKPSAHVGIQCMVRARTSPPLPPNTSQEIAKGRDVISPAAFLDSAPGAFIIGQVDNRQDECSLPEASMRRPADEIELLAAVLLLRLMC